MLMSVTTNAISMFWGFYIKIMSYHPCITRSMASALQKVCIS